MSPSGGKSATDVRLENVEKKLDETHTIVKELSVALIGTAEEPGRITKCIATHEAHDRRIESLESTRRVLARVAVWIASIATVSGITTYVGFRVNEFLTRQPSFQENVEREVRPWAEGFTSPSTTTSVDTGR